MDPSCGNGIYKHWKQTVMRVILVLELEIPGAEAWRLDFVYQTVPCWIFRWVGNDGTCVITAAGSCRPSDSYDISIYTGDFLIRLVVLTYTTYMT